MMRASSNSVSNDFCFFVFNPSSPSFLLTRFTIRCSFCFSKNLIYSQGDHPPTHSMVLCPVLLLDFAALRSRKIRLERGESALGRNSKGRFNVVLALAFS